LFFVEAFADEVDGVRDYVNADDIVHAGSVLDHVLNDSGFSTCRFNAEIDNEICGFHGSVILQSMIAVTVREMPVK